MTSLTATASTNTNSIASTTNNHSTSASPPSSGGGGGGGNSAVNPYFKLEDLHQAAAAAAQVAQHQRQPNTNLYWPGIQGLIANPNLWRDRFNGRLPLSRHTHVYYLLISSFQFHKRLRSSAAFFWPNMRKICLN